MNKLRRQSGFTLIEVLVSLLILGVGLLGLVGMQAHALRNNFNAYLRSQATFSADQILDRMRANKKYAKDSEGYDIALGGSASGTGCRSTCTPAQIKDTDLDQWLTMVERLPDGKGSVDVDSATGEAVVTIRWNDRRDGVAGSYFEYVARSQL